jgi:hypothetical protein
MIIHVNFVLFTGPWTDTLGMRKQLTKLLSKYLQTELAIKTFIVVYVKNA